MTAAATRIDAARSAIRLGRALIVATALLTVPVAAAPRQSDAPAEALEWLVGTWQAEFRPHGPDRAAPTLEFRWGVGKGFLRMLGTQPDPDGGLVPEHETVIAWNPVTERFEFLGIYVGAGHRMMEDGHVELLEGGGVRLHMAVHYAAGETLPFSDGAVAGPGGHTLRFRRTLTPDGPDRLRGTFFLQRGGRWENPHPQLGLDFYPWSRVSADSTSELRAIGSARRTKH